MKERNNPLLKKLDKWIGCPALYAMGIFHKNHAVPQLFNNNIRVALIKTAAVGDTILLSAMVDEIRNQYPLCHITVICSNNNLGMVKILSGVNEIEVFDMRSPFRSVKRIRSLGSFDFVLDFGPWPRINAIIASQIKANYKVGFKRTDTHRHYIYDAKVEHSDMLHEIENYRNILRAAGFTVNGLIPNFRTDKRVRKDSNYVVLHPYPGGAMSQQRSWSDERWIELGRYIFRHYGATILLSGGPDDKAKAEIVASCLRNSGVATENIAGRYSLQEMASVLQYAQLVVSVNTGIMHYAAAVGVPLIAIHGATSEKRWGPLSDNAVVVKSGEGCQPCISLGFESDCMHPYCMENVTVDMVMLEVDKKMKQSLKRLEG